MDTAASKIKVYLLSTASLKGLALRIDIWKNTDTINNTNI
jgi:hypothetical protein